MFALNCIIQLNFRRNPGFFHNRHVHRNRQIIQKISSMRKLLTNRVVPAQNFLAKIEKFSQKSVSFLKNLQIFAQKMQIFAKICKFSQKFAIFCPKKSKFSQKSANFRKNRENFRKNRQIFASICKFFIFKFSASRPTS